MIYVKKNIIRPHDKYKELKRYIMDGDKIFRKDIIKMGFNRVDVTLYNYCLRNKLILRKVNGDYWIKDYTATRMDMLPSEYKNRIKRNSKLYRQKKKKVIDNYCE